MGFKKDGDVAGDKKAQGSSQPTNPLTVMRQHKEQLKNGRGSATPEPEVAQPKPAAVPEVRQDKTERARSTPTINKGSIQMSDNNFFNAAVPLISNASSGQELSRVVEMGRKYLAEEEQRLSGGGFLKWNLIPIPGGEVNYLVDSVALTATMSANGATVTAATCLLLMGKAKLPDQVEKEQGLQFIYSSVPSDIYTAGYKTGAARQIKTVLGQNAGDITLLGSVTVPNTFRYDEADIRNMLMNVINDVYFGFIDLLTEGERNFDITAVIKDDEEVAGRVVLLPGDDTNVFGQPRRRDISMTVTKQPKRSTNVINAVEGARTGELAKIDGYGDYVWLGRKQESRRSRRNRRDEAELDIYGLGLNITLLSSGDRQTTEMQLLGLSAVSALVQEDIITQAMQPGGDSAYLRSPEALAVEQDKEFGEVPKNPTKEEWAELNEAVVREDSLFVFLHVEENGLLGRVQQTFLDAASGNRTAQQELYDAAFRLTNGKIVDYIDEDMEFGRKEDRVILLGYFTDDKGIQRDLREIDRFYIMTHYGLKGDTKTLELWDNACNNTALPMGARLSKMEEIIRGCVTNYVVTGHATPIHINPDWLFGLTDATAAADLAIPTEGLTVDSSRHQSYTSTYQGRGYEGSAFRGRGRGRDYGFNR